MVITTSDAAVAGAVFAGAVVGLVAGFSVLCAGLVWAGRGLAAGAVCAIAIVELKITMLALRMMFTGSGSPRMFCYEAWMNRARETSGILAQTRCQRTIGATLPPVQAALAGNINHVLKNMISN
jgi:hypothetical protein